MKCYICDKEEIITLFFHIGMYEVCNECIKGMLDFYKNRSLLIGVNPDSISVPNTTIIPMSDIGEGASSI